MTANRTRHGTKIDSSCFYWISQNLANPAATFDVSMDALRSFSSGETVPDEPVVFGQDRCVERPIDTIWPSVRHVLVSPRVLEVLSAFSGWDTYPVALSNGCGEELPGYKGLAILGRSGGVVSSRSSVIGEGIQAEYVGLTISPEEWDGSDIFYPAFGTGPIISAPLRNALRSNNIRGYEAVRLDKVRMLKAWIDQMWDERSGPFANLPR